MNKWFFDILVSHENILDKPVKLLDFAMLVAAQMFLVLFSFNLACKPNTSEANVVWEDPYSYLHMKHLRLIAVANNEVLI
jgi:hypothetical protein